MANVLNLDALINVSVSPVTLAEAATPGFNTGLIVGDSGTAYSDGSLVKKFASADEVKAIFSGENAKEYLAAKVYFAQSPAPKAVYVASYKDSFADYGTFIKACRAECADWYGLYIAGGSLSEHRSFVDWSKNERIAIFYETDEVTELTAVKATGANNFVGIKSAVKYAGAALMGLAMGLNSGAENSAFTLRYKELKGIETSDITETELAEIAANGGNAFVSRAGKYKVVEKGITCDGTPFDELLGLHQLIGEIQFAVMDLLTSPKTAKVPYTDDGTMLIVSAISDACSKAYKRGFLTPGVWEGEGVLSLENGDALVGGFYVGAEPVANQSYNRRKDRIAPPIYVCLKLAGAIEQVMINVSVEQ